MKKVNGISWSEFRKEIIAMKIQSGMILTPDDMKFIYAICKDVSIGDAVTIYEYKPVLPKYRPNRRTTVGRNLEIAGDYEFMKMSGKKHSEIVPELKAKHSVQGDKALENAIRDGRILLEQSRKRTDSIWEKFPQYKPYDEHD